MEISIRVHSEIQRLSRDIKKVVEISRKRNVRTVSQVDPPKLGTLYDGVIANAAELYQHEFAIILTVRHCQFLNCTNSI